MKLRRYLLMAFFLLMRDGHKRAKILKRIKYFHAQGEKCFFASISFGTEPWLLSFGDNVHAASGARFITHDVAGNMLQRKGIPAKITNRVGKIEIGNNVIIGANAMILYDVKIGNDVIIAAGSVVTSDVPDGTVVAGVPARKIENSEEYYEKILAFSEKVNWDERIPLKKRKILQEEYFWKE